jgi:hypothetical protein
MKIARALVLGLAVAVILISGVAVSQFGVSESKTRVLEALDSLHIVGDRTRLLHKAEALERADARRDAESAVSRGDKRLLGFSLALEGPVTTPGVEGSLADSSRKQLGIRLLFQGCVQVPEFEQYRKATENYARAYNTAVLRLLASKGGAA